MEALNKDELWKVVLGELELSISKASFTTWFSNTSVEKITDNQIVVNVPNIFAKEWLEKKYKKDILKSVQKQVPQINSFICQVNTNKKRDITEKDLDNPKKSVDSVRDGLGNNRKQNDNISINNSNINIKTESSPSGYHSIIRNNNTTFNTNLNKKYLFDNFIVSSSNELAHAACQSIANNPGVNYNPLFIYGGVGLGKTHLLQATGNKILELHPSYKIRYSSMERFTNELVDAIQNNKAKEFKNQYINLDVLILDDIQFLSGKEKTQEEFFHVFESLYQLGKQVILSSDRPPKSISTLEDRLRSRFEGGMIVDVEKPDFETRLAIIEQKLKEKGFSLDREISEYLAKNIYHNVRELEGALNKIIVTFQFQNRKPELDDVIHLTKDIVSINHQKDLTPEKILETIADYFNIKAEEIVNKSRKKQVVKPRQIAFYLLRTEIDMSYPEIGKFMGGRDHSTAIYAYNKIKKELDLSDDLNNQVKFIREKLVDY